MNINFLEKMPIELVKQYDRPFIITFSCLPGSGKTDIARKISRDLKIYLLSNDYIRNYFYQFVSDYTEEQRIEIDEKVSKINKERLSKIVNNNISFVYDRCMNKEEDYQKLLEILGNKYDIIKIKIESTDIDNINRIHEIKIDYNKHYNGVIGDDVEYLSDFPDEVYYEIKERIPMMLDDSKFDFIIKNNNNQLVDDAINFIKNKY